MFELTGKASSRHRSSMGILQHEWSTYFQKKNTTEGQKTCFNTDNLGSQHSFVAINSVFVDVIPA